MSDITATKLTEMTKALTAAVGYALLKGRCMANPRKYDGRFFHLIALPATDAFSFPALVEVESNQRRFSEGDDCQVIVKLGGYKNDYRAKDGNGEISDVKSARNTLVGVFAD